ncbi:MAG TPA: hypothetical protein VM283_04745, partial [Armatimonadota bacterium]|nr:hypothetical protein [Armatimonadota bacterium]
TVTNDRNEARGLSLVVVIPLWPSADRLFAPAGSDPSVELTRGAEPVKYGYQTSGNRLAMPLAQVYSAERDWGVALFGEVGLLVESMRFDVSRSAKATVVEVSLPLSLGPGESATRRIYLAATRGDWRPALAAVLAAFPQAFEPQNLDVNALHGPFEGGGIKDDARLQELYDQGVRAVEIHGWSPLYGEYVPVKEPWTPFCDDKWHWLKSKVPPEELPRAEATWQEIQAFVEQHYPPDMTLARLNDYIDRLHAHQIKGLIYFNPTEAWAPWAAAMFPDDRRLDSDGNPIPAWYESSSMIPDRERPWGKYLLDQIRGELRIFPKVDGVFFDQSAGGGHDLTLLCAEGCRIVREQGKICWWNGPYNMELAALADGMMTEGGGTERYRVNTEIIQYYGMAGKPIVSLGPASDAAYAEMLIHGIFPKPVSYQSEQSAELARRWFPLFEWMRNRRWVLTAHALQVPDGIDANLFSLPDGSLVVPMVAKEHLADEVPTRLNSDITVRGPQTADLRAAYLLSPDLVAYHRLDMQRKGEELTVTVPRLGRAGLIVLPAGRVIAALDGPPHLVRGREGIVRQMVDNWTDKPAEVSMKVSTPWGEATATESAAPGSSVHLEVPVIVPADFDGHRVAITASAMVGGVEIGGDAELWVDDPLVLLADVAAEVRDDQPLPVEVRVLSHLPEARQVRVEATSGQFSFDPPARELTLRPEQVATVTATGHAEKAGEAFVTVRATAGEATAEARSPVEVVATAIAPGGFDKIRAAELRLDTFGVGSGRYEYKPIFVNGVEIGVVPTGGGDSWSPDKTVQLPPEALKAIAERNEVEIHNEVGDAFKVRNLQLVLRMAGGVTVVSSVDRDVYTGWTGWLHGEGHEFASGQPLTGIVLTIPVDPNRREKYEELFGTPASARLVLEVNGSDGPPYAHKPVLINNRNIGDLPQAGSTWTERPMDLPAEALSGLMGRNTVEIFNSEPPDA